MNISLLANILHNFYLLIKRKDTSANRLRLFVDFSRFTLKYLFLCRMLKINPSYERVLTYQIKLLDYSAFYNLFKEIFIRREYHFIPTKENPFIIDCGSNIGMAILYFKYYFPDSKIIAIEPGKQAFAMLKNNCSINRLKEVHLYNVALGAKKGNLRLYSPINERSGTSNSIMAKNAGPMFNFVSMVNCRKLSEFIIKKVDFIKMDVEGAEMEIFKELSTSKKLRMVTTLAIELHHHIFSSAPYLGRFLYILERHNFDYFIYSRFSSGPAYQKTCSACKVDEQQTIMIYASQCPPTKK